MTGAGAAGTGAVLWTGRRTGPPHAVAVAVTAASQKQSVNATTARTLKHWRVLTNGRMTVRVTNI
ncbi:MAG: hypothetical protein ABSC51_01920 [Gaiellaceae bacterium]